MPKKQPFICVRFAQPFAKLGIKAFIPHVRTKKYDQSFPLLLCNFNPGINKEKYTTGG